MRFRLSGEQRDMRDAVRDLLAHSGALEAARERLESNAEFDRATWRRLCEELELVALHVPEELGGQGFGLIELGIALEQMGRVVYSGPFLADAALAVTLLVEGGASAGQLAPILSGEVIATVATSAPVARRTASDSVVLEGELARVPNLVDADQVIVSAATPDAEGLSLFLVRIGEGATVTASETIDPTRPFGVLALAGARGELVGEEGGGGPALARARPMTAAAVAVELVGVADAALELAVAYAKERRQFGVPIGSFQAIQHKCADMLVALEMVRSTSYHALWACATRQEDDYAFASLALAQAIEMAQQVTRSAIQVHGGIGFTWEHDLQLYFRRAAAAPALIGSAREHWDIAATAFFSAGDRQAVTLAER